MDLTLADFNGGSVTKVNVAVGFFHSQLSDTKWPPCWGFLVSIPTMKVLQVYPWQPYWLCDLSSGDLNRIFLNASQTPEDWFPRVVSFLLIPNLLWQSVFPQSFKPETSVNIFQY